MEKKFTNFPKVNFENSSIQMNTEINEVTNTLTILYWIIHGFSELKKKVFYRMSVSTVDNNMLLRLTFRLLKLKSTLFVALHANQVGKNVSFKFVAKEGSLLSGNEPQEILDGLYVAEYSLNVIKEPENQFLSNDTLTIRCRYGNKPVERMNIVAPFGSWRNKSDTRILCGYMKALYLSSWNYDFSITAKGVVFRVHKLILVARSRFFHDLFSKHDNYITKRDISINAHPSIMNEVLLFVYSGELKYMEFECMISVLSIACLLMIDSLVARCITYFKENMTLDNVRDVLDVAHELSLVLLKNTAFSFLLHNMDELQDSELIDMMAEAACELFRSLEERTSSINILN